MGLASSVVNLLETLSVSRRSAFWLAGKPEVLLFAFILGLTTNIVSQLNFATAGSFMIFMFLHSTVDGENDYWMNKLSKYRTLLRAHLPGFGVTKHALIRLDLLASPANLNQCLTEHKNRSRKGRGKEPDLLDRGKPFSNQWVQMTDAPCF